MSELKVLALFTLCFSFSQISFAVTAADVAHFWAKAKFANCDPLGDFVASRGNQSRLRELAGNECSSIPNIPKNCFAAADAILSTKFDERGTQLGCKIAALPAPSTAAEPARKISMMAACNTMTMAGPKTVATNKGSVLICEVRSKCMSGFTVYGRDFEEGDYRLTCTVTAGTMCSNVKADGCSNPTIQKQGLIWNDAVVPLNEAYGVQ